MEKPNLGEAGSDLWDLVSKELKFDAAGYKLLEECCRTADIIAKLNGALKSKHQEWVTLVEDDEAVDLERDTTTVKVMVVVNPLLGEIRQQRLALRQMLAHLRIGKVAGAEQNVSTFWTDMEKNYESSPA